MVNAVNFCIFLTELGISFCKLYSVLASYITKLELVLAVCKFVYNFILLLHSSDSPETLFCEVDGGG